MNDQCLRRRLLSVAMIEFQPEYLYCIFVLYSTFFIHCARPSTIVWHRLPYLSACLMVANTSSSRVWTSLALLFTQSHGILTAIT